MDALTFEDAPEAPRKPAGPPSVPISTDNLDRSALPPPRPGEPGAPSVPKSKDNFDYAGYRASQGVTFDEAPEASDAQKSVARIRQITEGKLKNQAYTPGPLDYIADAGTFSLSRPVSALAGTIYDKVAGTYPDASLNEIWQGNVGFMNDRAAQAEKNTPLAPVVGAVAQLPGTMLTGGSGSGLFGVGRGAASASTKRVMGEAAAQGAVEGAAQHAETPGSALQGAATNAALSAGTAGVIDKGTKTVMPAAQRGAAAEARAEKGIDPQRLRDDASNFYTQMDNAGVRYDAQQTAPLYTALHDMRNSARYSEEGTPELKGYFNKLMSLSRNEMSYTELQNLRSAVAEKTHVADGATRKAAGEMLGHIDHVIRDVPAVNPQGLDMATNHRQASSLWRSSNLASDINYKAGKAQRMDDAGKPVNPDAKARDDLFNYRERINDPKRPYNPLDDTQKALLDRAIEGRTGTNIKRNVGNFLVDNAKGLGATLGTGAGLLGWTHGNAPGWNLVTAAAGVPIWAGSHIGGKALQHSAATGRQTDINALLRDIKGSPPHVPGSAVDRNDLVKILFAQDLARMAPRVGSQELGNPPKEEEKR